MRKERMMRFRTIALIGLLLALSSFARAQTRPNTTPLLTIQAAQVSGVAATTVTRNTVTGLGNCNSLAITLRVTASGTATGTLQVWLEDSFDGGTTWQDLVSSNTFAFGAATANQIFWVNGFIATTGTQGAAPAIEALAAGTVRSGPFGDRIRVREKVTSPSGSPVGPTYSIYAVCGP